MTESKLATFKIQTDKWDAFMGKSAEQGTNASALLKLFIDRYLDGSIDLEQPQAPSNIDALIEGRLEPIRGDLAELRSRLDGCDRSIRAGVGEVARDVEGLRSQLEKLSLGKPKFLVPTRAMPVK
jgi:hypothetical protein